MARVRKYFQVARDSRTRKYSRQERDPLAFFSERIRQGNISLTPRLPK